MVYVFILIAMLSFIVGIWKKKPYLLLTPFLLIFAFVAYEIIRVPMPLWDTLKFIFSLR